MKSGKYKKSELRLSDIFQHSFTRCLSNTFLNVSIFSIIENLNVIQDMGSISKAVNLGDKTQKIVFSITL